MPYRRRTSSWRKYLWLVVAALLALAAYIQFAGHSYFWTALRYTYLSGHNTAHIDDATNFVQAPIAGGTEQPWPIAGQQAPMSAEMQAFLKQHRSAAFLVAHKGQLIHETLSLIHI